MWGGLYRVERKTYADPPANPGERKHVTVAPHIYPRAGAEFTLNATFAWRDISTCYAHVIWSMDTSSMLQILPFECSHHENVGDIAFHWLEHRQFLSDIVYIGAAD